MDIYEEMLLEIVDILKKHNRPLPDLTHKEAIEEIRKIVSGDITYADAEKVTPDSSDVYTCSRCTHLIFKDYEHHEGRCSITGSDHKFEDMCDHIEDIM